MTKNPPGGEFKVGDRVTVYVEIPGPSFVTSPDREYVQGTLAERPKEGIRWLVEFDRPVHLGRDKYKRVSRDGCFRYVRESELYFIERPKKGNYDSWDLLI